jgi:hypothetical protein
MAVICLAKGLVPIKNVFSLLHFAWAVFYAMENCPNEDKKSMGTYWELQPGESLFFNNWRVHSDHRFGNSDIERHTLDLRCYSKVEMPFPFADERDFLLSVMPSVAKMQDATTECLLRLFDYPGEQEFYDAIGVKKPKKRLSYALGNVLHNYCNAGEEGLLSEKMFHGMQLHSLNVRRMYDEGTLNYTAFAQCVNEHSETLFAAVGSQAHHLNLSELSFTSLAKLAVFGMRVKLGYWGEKLLVLFLATILYLLCLFLKHKFMTQKPRYKLL